MNNMEKVCVVCGNNALQRCGGCEAVYYCGKQHQKKHWKTHAAVCVAYKMASDPILGRHYVATRNISRFEIVMKDERPMVAGPMPHTVPVCLGCYVVLSKDTAVPCSRCGWPLCGDCKDHGSECNFTSSRRDNKVSINSFGYHHPSYQCISVVRALCLKQSNPKIYQKLLLLEDHCSLMQERAEHSFQALQEGVRFIKRFFKVDDIPETEIQRIFGILQVNGHEVPISEPAQMAVYDKASFIEHNCHANCSKTFTEAGGVIIHAAVYIKKGENISISYTDPLWGTVNRRYHLSQTKFFDCTCDRCKDPTEFGTMYSCISCENKNCKGFSFPKSFLSPAPLDYECNKCGAKTARLKVEQLIDKIGVELSQIKKKDDVETSRALLDRYVNLLHKDHYYLVDISVALAQSIGHKDGGLQNISHERILEKIGYCFRLITLLGLLTPGDTRIRGILYFELHAATAELGRREVGDAKIPFLVSSRDNLGMALDLLRYEPSILPEGKIADQGCKNLKQLNEFLKVNCLACRNQPIDNHKCNQSF